MYVQKMEKPVHDKRVKSAVAQRRLEFVPSGGIVAHDCVKIASYCFKCKQRFHIIRR